jgi:hypothetical protein
MSSSEIYLFSLKRKKREIAKNDLKPDQVTNYCCITAITMSTGAKKSDFDADVDKLFKMLEGATEATRKRIIDSLPEETLLLLRTKANPYKVPVYKTTEHAKDKLLCFGIINLREKYYQRFAMTSLIGYVYRMLEEFTPSAAEGLPSRDDPKFAVVLNRKLASLKRRRPIEISAKKIAALKETVESATEATKEVKQAYFDIQIEQLRLAKYKVYFANKDREELKFQLDQDNLDLSRAKSMHTTAVRRLDVTTRKLELRREFERNDSAKSYKVDLSTMDFRNAPVPDYSKEDPKRCTLSDYDKYHSVENFEEQLKLRTTEAAALAEDVAKITALVDKKQAEYDMLTNTVKDLQSRVASIRSVVTDKFPTLVKSLDFDVSEYSETDDEYDAIVDECKRELGITETKEDVEDRHRAHVQEFLDTYFVYNPDLHVQSAYKPNYDDPLRTPLMLKTMEFHQGKRTEEQHKQDLEQHAADLEKYRVIAEEKIERSVIPPDDTFFRWNRYVDNNYEQLRQATDDIYCEKSDLEFSLVPLAMFEGESAKTEADEWQRKFASEYEGDVYQASFGIHNLLGSWMQNREKREFYTQNTEIVKRIIKQSEDDQKMGRRLMKDRAQKKKLENEKQTGPDPKGLKEYTKKHLLGGLEEGGAKHVSEIDAGSSISDISRNDLDAINDQHESKRTEVEVGWKHIRPEKRGRKGRRAGRTDAGKFHIAAESPNQLTKGYKMSAEDMHRHLSIVDMKKSIRETTEAQQ